jgi:hypothetical protein
MFRKKEDKAGNDLRDYKKYVMQTGGGKGKPPPPGTEL